MRQGPGFLTVDAKPAPTLAALARAVSAMPGSCLFASGEKTSRRSRTTIAAFDPFLVATGERGGADSATVASGARDGANDARDERGRVGSARETMGEKARSAAATARACRGVRIEWRAEHPAELPPSGLVEAADPFPFLAELLAAFPIASSPAHPPFTGGLAGWFGYDLGRAFESVTERVPDPLALPLFHLGYFDLVLAHDHLTKKSTIFSSGYPERDPARRAARARERAAWLLERLAEAARSTGDTIGDLGGADGRSEGSPSVGRGASPDLTLEGFPPGSAVRVGSRSGSPIDPAALSTNLSRNEYVEAVRRVKNFIRAGDIFQANVTHRFTWDAPIDPASWFVDLLERNPVAFASYVHAEDHDVVSLSPERFLRVSGDRVETAPIKGTRPRSSDRAVDERNARDLLASPKDRAELIMIVDLLRNDLGRVAVSGSVEVPELYALESYATVHHLVSRITARLRPGIGPLDVLRAAFPGGSISGAPKIRAMEIIDLVEPHARGPFMGAIGYVGANGEMDTAIAIRTAVLRGGKAHLQVGCGIVSDSSAEDEYDESLHKAAAILGPLPHLARPTPASR